MKVSVFGNPDIKEDSLVVDLVPELRRRFKEVKFKVEDPSEGLKPPPADAGWVILDVAKGIEEVKVFEDLDKLESLRRVSLHDYEVGMELKLLKKLGKVGELKIIAVPIRMKKERAMENIVRIIKKLIS